MKLFEPIFYSLFIYVVKSSTIQSQNNPQGNENKSAVRGDTRNLSSVSVKFIKRNGIREEKGEVPEKSLIQILISTWLQWLSNTEGVLIVFLGYSWTGMQTYIVYN